MSVITSVNGLDVITDEMISELCDTLFKLVNQTRHSKRKPELHLDGVSTECAKICCKELLSVVPNVENKVDQFFKRKDYESISKPVFKICEKLDWPKVARNKDQLVDLLICAYTEFIEREDKYKDLMLMDRLTHVGLHVSSEDGKTLQVCLLFMEQPCRVESLKPHLDDLVLSVGVFSAGMKVSGVTQQRKSNTGEEILGKKFGGDIHFAAELYEVTLGKVKSLLDNPFKEFTAVVYLRKDAEITHDEWEPSHSDTKALLFNITGHQDAPKTTKRPLIPEWEWDKKIEMADWPPLDRQVFVKNKILAHVNEKRDEVSVGRLHHDLQLDRISKRFNELKVSADKDSTEDEVQQFVMKEFNLHMEDLNNGRKNVVMPNQKTQLQQGKYNGDEDNVPEIEDQVKENYFVMEENSDQRRQADFAGYNQVGFDVTVRGQYLLFSITLAWQPLVMKELKFVAPSALQLTGQLVNVTHPQKNKLSLQYMQLQLNNNLITTSRDFRIKKDYEFEVEVKEILPNWYQKDDQVLHVQLADIDKLRAEGRPELTEADADFEQKHPLVMMPDKRVELTERKRKKELEGDIDEMEEEEFEDEMENNKVDQMRAEADNFDYDAQDDAELLDMTSDYQKIRTQDVKAKLLELMEEAKVNHTNLVMQNQRLQRLVQEKKGSKGSKPEGEMNDQKYLRTLGNAQVVRKKLKETQDRQNKLSEEMQNQLQRKQTNLHSIREKLSKFKEEIYSNSFFSGSNRSIPEKNKAEWRLIEEQLEEKLQKQHIQNVRQANMQERNQKQIEKLEKLEDGQHMVDFEQMKIENQTLQEKIDDRKDEIEKLNAKILSFVEVMTHLREKLHFEKALEGKQHEEHNKLSSKVQELRNKVKEGHDKKTHKQKENELMKLELGIVNNSKLMDDLKYMKLRKQRMAEDLEKLKGIHSELDEYLKRALKLQGLDINQKIASTY